LAGHILESTFMVHQLPPWHENISKRQVKSPKMHIRDSGIFHSLIGVEDKEALMFHPKLGPSWEGFAIGSIIRHHRAGPGDCYFWSTHLTRSLRIAQQDLKIDELYVVYPGAERFPLDDRVRAIGLEMLVQGGREG